MNSDNLILIGLFVATAMLMLFCKVVYNLLGKASDLRKREVDRARGSFEETRPESLADRYSKH
jgi:hypothetical protein